MGTVASIHWVAPSELRPVFDEAVSSFWAGVEDLESIFSAFRETSDICRLSRGEITLGEAGPRVSAVFEACGQWRERTGGLFDAWWKGWFDPTGYVKGWAIETLAEACLFPLLGYAGSEAVGVGAGGDLWLRTNPGADWT